MLKKRVLCVSPSYPYPEHLNGVNKINANLIGMWDGYDMDVLCPEPQGGPEISHPQVHTIGAVGLNQGWPRLLARWLITGMPIGVERHRAVIDALAARVREIGDQYDVIHLSSMPLALVAEHFPPALLSKCVAFPIDSSVLFWSRRHKAETNILRKAFCAAELVRARTFERSMARRFEQIVFVSQVDADLFKEVTGKPAIAVPNGVDVDQFAVGLGEDEPHSLTFVGNWDYWPNYDAAIFLAEEVMPLVLAQVPGAKLYLVGPGRDRLEKKIKPNSSVELVGFVDNLPGFLRRARVFAAPLRAGSGIKNKVLEAMAASRLVVGTPISFDGIDCQDDVHCHVALGEDAGIFAKAVVKAIQMGDTAAAAIQQRARQLIEDNYSWKAVRQRYASVYSAQAGVMARGEKECA